MCCKHHISCYLCISLSLQWNDDVVHNASLCFFAECNLNHILSQLSIQTYLHQEFEASLFDIDWKDTQASSKDHDHEQDGGRCCSLFLHRLVLVASCCSLRVSRLVCEPVSLQFGAWIISLSLREIEGRDGRRCS